jgi:type IV secretory pathway TrbD component
MWALTSAWVVRSGGGALAPPTPAPLVVVLLLAGVARALAGPHRSAPGHRRGAAATLPAMADEDQATPRRISRSDVVAGAMALVLGALAVLVGLTRSDAATAGFGVVAILAGLVFVVPIARERLRRRG